jgi:ribonuclease-3
MEYKQNTNYMNDGFIVKNQDGEDEIIHIPYNLNNVLISESDIIQILNQYNVKIDKINHIEYFRQAFTHKSYCKKDIYPQNILDAAKNELNNPPELLELREKSYERLEYFGDRVLKVIVSMYLFHRYPKQDEGFMTRLQTKIEDKKNLAVMSKEIGLGKYFIISRQIEMMNGRNLEKIHEDVFESFVGALFLSNGFEPCMFLIVNLLETLIDYSEKLYCDNNYKDQLLRIHHQNKWKFPQYVTIHFEGPPHKRKYIMGVERHDAEPNCPLDKKCISFGIGSSKKEGEQNAAKMALVIHGILKQDQYTSNDIYYPPWDKINNWDGETMIIKSNDPTESEEQDKLVNETKIEAMNSSEELTSNNLPKIESKSSNNKANEKVNDNEKANEKVNDNEKVSEKVSEKPSNKKKTTLVEQDSDDEIDIKSKSIEKKKNKVEDISKNKSTKKDNNIEEPKSKKKVSGTKTTKKSKKSNKIENLSLDTDSDGNNSDYSDKSI